MEEHSGGKDGTAGAKVLRQEPVDDVPRSARRPVWLEQREQGQRNTSWGETEGGGGGGGADSSGPGVGPGMRLSLKQEIPRVLSRAGTGADNYSNRTTPTSVLKTD